MINAGIIGLGPVWETRYKPALQSLSSKVRVTAVYDPVEERAVAAARELDAQVVPAIGMLSRRRDLDAGLILGKDWTNLAALKFLCEARKPAYIAGALGQEIPAIGEIHLLALSEGLTFMPEFSRRYTPATFRLKELIATRLGAPCEFQCTARLPHPRRRDVIPGQADAEDFLIGLIDLCLQLLPGVATEVRAVPLAETSGSGLAVTIAFRGRGEVPISASMQIYDSDFSHGSAPDSGLEAGDVRLELRHAEGEVYLRNSDEIRWSHQGRDAVEVLTSDRPDVEVMLDHFFRRVVGGLIPVADLSDICRAINVFRALEASKSVGRPVVVPGQSER
jgi:predicted dehydrogenase